jgi:ferrous iron transport protein B
MGESAAPMAVSADADGMSAAAGVAGANGSAGGSGAGLRRIALLGNPNTGKTTLFNRLCGLRHKTSNFPGTTLEARLGRVMLERRLPAGSEGESVSADAEASGVRAGLKPAVQSVPAELIDLPGVYSIELEQLEANVCRDVLAGATAPRSFGGGPVRAPEAICVVADATNLGRSLSLAGEALRRRLPTVVAVNMIDLAHRRGLHVDAARLSDALGCRVVCVSARTGEGLAELREALSTAQIPTRTPPGDEAGLRRWADELFAHAASGAPEEDTFTDRLDRAFTHPILGLVLFAVVMTGLFWGLFKLAAYPMDWIDMIFAHLGGLVEAVVPAGAVQDLLANGVVAGVGATVIFLPQICLLFFLISLLEDTGYLARAAFVMDRLLRPFGLSGHAFVPLLSAHACALPGIMACRGIPDRRDRLAAILVAPFMSCSARIPVYALLVVLLFPRSPSLQALAFTGCYFLGAIAGLFTASLFRSTILRGKGRPMVMELPSYKRPSLRTALLTTYDRAVVFLKKAGTAIVAISIVLWWLGSYPHVKPPAEAAALEAQAAAIAPEQPEQAAAMEAKAATLEARHAKRHSFIGMLGAGVEPIFRPIGYDRQLSVGVLASFAAREVFVTTMAVIVIGDESADVVGDDGVRARLATATRDDGTPIFTAATSWSLLVYYVLAMQCLPTLVLTAREAGGVKWALLQLGWMCGLAYVCALVVYQVMA